MLGRHLQLFAIACLLPNLGLAQNTMVPLEDEEFQTQEAYIMDARCSAALRLMSDLGKQRGSELAPIYESASEFMAGQSTTQHTKNFGTSNEDALPIVQSVVLNSHAAYLTGLEDGTGVETFGRDVVFCNHRFKAYVAILEAGQ